jgi:putative ABC transport system permease protein
MERLRDEHGVVAVEPFRAIPVRLVGARGEYRTSLLALHSDARLRSIVDVQGRRHRVPPVGLLLARPLADTLGVMPGGFVEVQVLEGSRRQRPMPVAGVVDDLLGMSAYADVAALATLTGDAEAHSGAWLRLDPREAPQVLARLKQMPIVAGVAARRAALEGFDRTIAESFRISLVVTLGFACIIAVGVVYNSGRITLSERARELASLRVLGFTRRETSFMLAGEQALLVLVSLPAAVGVALFLGWLISVRFDSTLFRLPVVTTPLSHLLGCAVVVVAAAGSAALILRRLGRFDLVRVLKTRE